MFAGVVFTPKKEVEYHITGSIKKKGAMTALRSRREQHFTRKVSSK